MERKHGDGSAGGGLAVTSVALNLDMHCKDCAQNIERWVLRRFAGVESTVSDESFMRLTIKGKALDSDLLRSVLHVKTKKEVTLHFVTAERTPAAPKVRDNGEGGKGNEEKGKIGERTATYLRVPMHCVHCARTVRKTLLRASGVEDVKVSLAADMVRVTGTAEAPLLVTRLAKKLGKKAEVLEPCEAGPVSVVDQRVLPANRVGCAQKARKTSVQAAGAKKVEVMTSTKNTMEAKGTVEAPFCTSCLAEKFRRMARALYAARPTWKSARIPLPAEPASTSNAQSRKQAAHPVGVDEVRDKRSESDQLHDGGSDRHERRHSFACRHLGTYGGHYGYYAMPDEESGSATAVLVEPLELFTDENPNACAIM